MYVVDESLSYTSEKRSDPTIVAPGKAGPAPTGLSSSNVGGRTGDAFVMDDAHGFLECSFIGALAWAGGVDLVDGAYTVTKSGVSVRVSTSRSRSCSKGSLQESVYAVSRTHGRL